MCMSYNSQIGENPDNNFFLGAAYHHLAKPKSSFFTNGVAELEPKWVGSAGIRFGVTPASCLTIQADHSRQGQFQETIAGALYGIKIGDDWENPLYTIHDTRPLSLAGGLQIAKCLKFFHCPI